VTQAPVANGGLDTGPIQLPQTGAGNGGDSDAWIAGVALLGGAAALLGARNVRSKQEPDLVEE